METIKLAFWLFCITTAILGTVLGDPEELAKFPPPERLKVQLNPVYRQINSAGPPDPYPRSRAALLLPMISVFEPAMHSVMQDLQAGIRFLFQTNNNLTLCIHGTGSTGMHTILDNLIEEGDKVLVLSLGFWGDVQANMSTRLGADTVKLTKLGGEIWTLPEIEEALSTHKPKILVMVRGQSDTGVRQCMEGVGDLCQKHDVLLVNDLVGMAGLQPVLMDKLKVDAAYTSSHRLGSIHGLSAVSVSPRALLKIQNRKKPPRSFQTDLLNELLMWTDPSKYLWHTFSLPLMVALRESLASIAAEGLESNYGRHENATAHFSKGMEALGLEHYVEKPENRMVSMTTVKPPKGKDLNKIVLYMREHHSIDISKGFGPTFNKCLRFAMFSTNANIAKVDNILRALKHALASPETDA